MSGSSPARIDPERPRRGHITRRSASTAILLILVATAPGAAQDAPAVTAGSDINDWIAPRHRIEFTLDPSAVSGGRVVVFIGETDYTALFERQGNRLVYTARPVPLPSGSHEATVYLVSPDSKWQEIGRFSLRVLSTEGFESVTVNPRLGLNNKGQVAEGHTPSENAPQRDAFQDFAVNTGWQTRHVRQGWSVSTQANFAGASNRQEALRFGQMQNDAPRFDLADYLVTIERGPVNLSAGHVSIGQNRHLLNGFGSRGIRADARIGSVARLSGAALNGNSIVGWANPFGLSNSEHRVVAGNLAIAVIPGRPELIELEGSMMGGSMLPLAGFTQGGVIDAEKSTGGGVRLTAADPAQRIRVDAGYSRSSFTNPLDPELTQDVSIVEVKRVERYARYVDANAQLLRGEKLPLPTTLALTFQHERVDPLYRNVASPVSSDLLNNTVSAQGTVGPLNLQASYGRTHDNLDDIESILTTHTRTSGGNAALPLAMVFTSASWLPTLSFTITRMHQFGAGIPPNSGFAETHVPDQVSLNKSFAVQWQHAWWRIGYQRNDTDQDNRQVDRQNADFVNATNSVSLGANLLRALDVSADIGFDDATNLEQSQKNSTKRIGGSINWRPTSTTALSSSFSRTRVKDDPLTSEQTSTDLRVELSQRFPLIKLSSGSSPGQLFVRFARQSGDLFSPFAPRSSRNNWNVNTGLTIGLL